MFGDFMFKKRGWISNIQVLIVLCIVPNLLLHELQFRGKRT